MVIEVPSERSPRTIHQAADEGHHAFRLLRNSLDPETSKPPAAHTPCDFRELAEDWRHGTPATLPRPGLGDRNTSTACAGCRTPSSWFGSLEALAIRAARQDAAAGSRFLLTCLLACGEGSGISSLSAGRIDRARIVARVGRRIGTKRPGCDQRRARSNRPVAILRDAESHS